MSKKIFTEKEIEKLKKNNYVKNVSEKGITYTSEFRKDYTNLMITGMKKKEIFITLNFDPNILGEQRMQSIHSRMKNNLKSNKTIDDARTTNSGKKRKTQSLESEKDELERLRHENVMLKAENDLLKKMEFLVMQKTLENSHQKKDTN